MKTHVPVQLAGYNQQHLQLTATQSKKRQEDKETASKNVKHLQNVLNK